MKKNTKHFLYLIIIVLLINFLGSFLYKRLDLTQDSRYTLSDVTIQILKKIKEPLYIDVFLDGDLPSEFKRLKLETKQLVEELQAYNNNIIFRFVNTTENKETSFTLTKELYKKGLEPKNITVFEKGKESQLMIFPWAIANYKGKEVNIPLLKNLMGATTDQKVVGSVQHLEYSFADAIYRASTPKQKKVAIIKGNGELPELLMAKFLMQTRQSYHIGPFTLDSVAKKPAETLQELTKYDLAIIAKPTEAFTDAEKQVLDQFIINGGKTIFLIDQVAVEMENLYNDAGETLAIPRDLNLNDMFFKYGIRINPNLIMDEMGTPLKLASGEQGSKTQFQEFNWKFAPFIFPESQHPIVKNLGGIRFNFASSIEVLKNDIRKTILLQSSPNSKSVGLPTIIGLNMVNDEIDLKEYQGRGNIPVAVLLEGKFESVYQNRVLPFKDNNFIGENKKTKMVIIADGDVIKNNVNKEFIPIELGYDEKTGNTYDNKDFIMNTVNYLLDDTGLINIRSKEVNLPLLDKELVEQNYSKSQIIAVGLPLLLLSVFGLMFTYLRKRKYGKQILS